MGIIDFPNKPNNENIPQMAHSRGGKRKHFYNKR